MAALDPVTALVLGFVFGGLCAALGAAVAWRHERRLKARENAPVVEWLDEYEENRLLRVLVALEYAECDHAACNARRCAQFDPKLPCIEDVS